MKFPTLIPLLALAGLVGAVPLSARAELKLPAIFGDNMVLQQQQRVPVWGWSTPGAPVTVSFAGQTVKTTAAPDGKWLVKLGKLKSSFTPQTLVVESGETKTLTNVLVGEVWLASGQSNMEKPVGKHPGQKPTLNAEQEIAAADYPGIRLFVAEKVLSAKPLEDLTKFKPWQPCSPATLDGMHFSAAAYFFGREIHTNLNVPVGLIESSWGGTRIEPWTPPAGFDLVPAFKALGTPVITTNKIPTTTPTVLYNAMIAPLAGFGMRGALWYQGESNCMGTNNEGDYHTYADKMTALVGGWRKLWHEGDFPFYFVQIAPFKYYGGKTVRVSSPEILPEFWELQALAAKRIKNAGEALTTDLVDNLDDIHPRDKANVGHRLALLARHQTYGQKDVVSAGPTFRKLKIEGGKAILKFDHADGGLVAKDAQPLNWFTIAGADGKFVPAQAAIVDDNTLEVSAAEVAAPVAVRFAWAETAQPNMYNEAGLPAEPFRTDAPRK